MSWDILSENEINSNKNRELKTKKRVNKKIYFDSDGTEIKIGYDDETGVGFVEILSE